MDRFLALDCFNTLVDDHTPDGDDWGLDCLVETVVAAGRFPGRAAFRTAYGERRRGWFPGQREKPLAERLADVFGPGSERLVADCLEVFEARYWEILRPAPGALAALDRLASTARLVVVSNHFQPGAVTRALVHCGFPDVFVAVINSADFGWKKPSPRIYHAACDALACSPNQAVFVGDSLANDVDGPRRLGLRSWYLYRHDRPGAPLPPLGQPVLHGWSALDVDRLFA